jgi:hypothetical protein
MSTTEDARLKHDPNLFEADRYHMVRKGWFPKSAIPVLEEMRQRHEELIDQRDAKQAEVQALRDRFQAEDGARQEAIDAIYGGGEGPKPSEVAVTPLEERARMLEEAEAHAHGAAKAALVYAYECLDRLRGPLPGDWNPHIEASQRRVPPDGEAAAVMRLINDDLRGLEGEIAEAQRVIAEASQKIREYQPLTIWLVRNGNGGPGQLINALHLTVPEAHTPHTKPEGTPDPPDWPRGWQTGMADDAYEDEDEDDDMGAVVEEEADGDGGFYVDPIEDAAPLNARKEQ